MDQNRGIPFIELLMKKQQKEKRAGKSEGAEYSGDEWMSSAFSYSIIIFFNIGKKKLQQKLYFLKLWRWRERTPQKVAGDSRRMNDSILRLTSLSPIASRVVDAVIFEEKISKNLLKEKVMTSAASLSSSYCALVFFFASLYKKEFIAFPYKNVLSPLFRLSIKKK